MTDVPTKMILTNPPPKAKTDLLTNSSGASQMGRVCFSLKLAFLYVLGKMAWLHPILPKSMRNMLPVDWNFTMFWTSFKSGGARIYEDYYIELRQPSSYQPKIDVEPKFQLSSDEIESLYRREGYLGPYDLLSPEEIETLRTHLLDTLIPSKSPWKYEVSQERGFVEWLFKCEHASLAEVRKKVIANYGSTVNRHLDDEQLRDLFTRKEITERCAQLLGPDLLLSRSNFFEVKGKTRGTHLHQASHWLFDDMRHSIVTPAKPDELWQLTCWIALTDTNEENGCLLVLPGTQDKMYPLIIDRSSSYFDPAFPYRVGDIELPPGAPEPTLIPVKAGQFILFTERVIHGATPNKTDESRWAVNCRFAKTDTQFFSQEIFDEGLLSTYANFKNVTIDKWRAVLARGEDRFGYNKLLTEDADTGVDSLQTQAVESAR